MELNQIENVGAVCLHVLQNDWVGCSVLQSCGVLVKNEKLSFSLLRQQIRGTVVITFHKTQLAFRLMKGKNIRPG